LSAEAPPACHRLKVILDRWVKERGSRHESRFSGYLGTLDINDAPLFLRENKESRAHGNDERISLESLTSGVRLLKEIVLAVQ
jgi:acetylornithine deacetylase/succinyl-diaminopimelate desuccinylase-like protein